MGTRTSAVTKGVTFGVLSGLSWLAGPMEAHAQVACPGSVQQPVVETTLVCDEPNSDGGCNVPLRTVVREYTVPATGFVLQNGVCTNKPTGSANDPAAFSGAALASQALSSLSQTTTQETARNTMNMISDRRREEEQRCPEGFRRVDASCERIIPREPPTRPATATPFRLEEKPTSKKTARKAQAEPAAARHERAPVYKGSYVEAPPPPPEPLPLPVEPEARFGAWTQVFGDYEKRNANGSAYVPCCTNNGTSGGANAPLGLSVQSRSGTVGFQVGGDFTARGLVLANDGLITGAFAGYVSSSLTLNTTNLTQDPSLAGNGYGHLNARLNGPTTGVYATYFSGPFSTDFLLKFDILTLNQNFTETLAFSTDGSLGSLYYPAFTTGYSNTASVNVLNTTFFGNLNYRFDVHRNFWVEPTVGAQYTNTGYGTNAAALGLADGSLVMVQGGTRFGFSALLNDQILMTTTLTGLAYSDILVSGGFLPGAGFAGNNILAQADQGQVRGRGVVAMNFDFGNGLKSFIQGEARGGKGLFGAGGKAGVRIEW
jgi:hypothetical protein